MPLSGYFCPQIVIYVEYPILFIFILCMHIFNFLNLNNNFCSNSVICDKQCSYRIKLNIVSLYCQSRTQFHNDNDQHLNMVHDVVAASLPISLRCERAWTKLTYDWHVLRLTPHALRPSIQSTRPPHCYDSGQRVNPQLSKVQIPRCHLISRFGLEAEHVMHIAY